MLDVPNYRLNDINVFNFRNYEWNEEKIIETITEMLQCAEDYNLRIKSISIKNKDQKDISEIKRTKSKILDIDLVYTTTEGTEDISLTYEIPWLINNHFYVSGNHKIGVYQLFDKPVIVRPDMVKIRTNIQSFMVELKSNMRRKYNYELSLFGKKLEFARLLIAYFGVTGIKDKFHLNENNEYIGEDQLPESQVKLIEDISKILNDLSIDKTKVLEQIFPKRTDQKIIEDLQLISKIDIFNSRYFKTDNIVEELLYYIDHEVIDDSDYNNKRIRFTEQMIYVHLTKDFYNLINIIRKNRKFKFSINSKVILSNINVSNIVQFDNSLNPLSELSMLLRTSLSGPGGFEKQNVPQSLRELHPSMIHLLDPADTADRDGCGTTQYLVPNVKINDDGTIENHNDKCLNSVAVSCVPFLEHDDATRLQMASSQQRHAIMLKKFDYPMIQSGIEGMYTDYTSFIFRAKRDGKIIYLDNEIICVKYDNKICEAFHIGYRKLYISTVDFYHVYFNIGDSVKSGDIIAESNYLKNGRITLGKNCLTCIMPWYGYNYEDGIIVSEKIVNEDYFTSVHYKDLVLELSPTKVLLNLNDDYTDYKPLPEIGQKLNKGDIYAKIKSIDLDTFDDVLFEPVTEEIIPEDCIIANIKIFANKWNKDFPQYEEFLKTFISNQKKKRSDLIDKLSNNLTKDELDRLIDTLEIDQTEKNNYKFKGDSIDGIRIELTIIYERKITIGDKIGNRHGNKGIISKIVPEDQMPRMPDGRPADIIINPLGITSRMNVGQIFESHLTMSLMNLKSNIIKMYEDKKDQTEIYEYIIGYVKLIDKTDDQNYTNQILKLLDKTSIDNFIKIIDNFFLIQPPFFSINRKDLDDIMNYTNTPFEYECFDPVSNSYIQNTINFGYIYWMKLNHIAQDKISYRGIGPYSIKTAQPLGGKSRKGGQRLGEMEIWAIIGHGAEKNLNEFISVKSDSIKLRNKYISEEMCNSDILLDAEDDVVPQSLRLLQTNLKSIGLDYELNEGEQPNIIDVSDDVDEPTPTQNLRRILGEDSDGETVEISSDLQFEIGGGNWGSKIKYDPEILSDMNDEKKKDDEDDE